MINSELTKLSMKRVLETLLNDDLYNGRCSVAPNSFVNFLRINPTRSLFSLGML